MNLSDISNKLSNVCDIYVDRFNIRRDDDWYLIKIQEELGELSSAYLKLTQRARIGEQSIEEMEKNLEDEVADVIAMTLLFARNKNINVEKALNNKWFRHL
jgi:NTP pyrophosphatase (non-canonical NTP hydrolase)